MEGERGVLTWEKVRRAIGPKIYYREPTGLICLENTHNMAGGTVTPLEVLEEIWPGAKEPGCRCTWMARGSSTRRRRWGSAWPN